METLLSKTKIAHSKRVFCKDIKYKNKINYGRYPKRIRYVYR